MKKENKNSMTVNQWLKFAKDHRILEPEVIGRIKHEISVQKDDPTLNPDKKFTGLIHILNQCFWWDISEHGYEYWNNILDYLINHPYMYMADILRRFGCDKKYKDIVGTLCNTDDAKTSYSVFLCDVIEDIPPLELILGIKPYDIDVIVEAVKIWESYQDSVYAKISTGGDE
jgi:hypothetical protein